VLAIHFRKWYKSKYITCC